MSGETVEEGTRGVDGAGAQIGTGTGADLLGLETKYDGGARTLSGSLSGSASELLTSETVEVVADRGTVTSTASLSSAERAGVG